MPFCEGEITVFINLSAFRGALRFAGLKKQGGEGEENDLTEGKSHTFCIGLGRVSKNLRKETKI